MNSNEGTKRGDGSVLSSIMGLGGLTLQQPSNVTRICRCIKGSSEKLVTQDGEEVLEKIKQITYYQSGIGTSNTEDKVSGGLTGEGEAGLAEHIREAYQFLAANYSEESNDEIVLVGFSRGSFTARSIAAFINDIGLLTPAGLKYFYPIFEDWENQQQEGYQTSFPQYPFASPRPDMYTHADEYAQKLFDLGFTRPGIKVKAIAVYDTVGKTNSGYL
jgi:uncharacterized protein (DUF2235 family)